MEQQYAVNVSCCNKHSYRQPVTVIIVRVIPSSRILGRLVMDEAEGLQKDRIKESFPLLIITWSVRGG